jgi:RHS repeat-associated protein
LGFVVTLLIEQPGVGPRLVSGLDGKPKEPSAFGRFLDEKDQVSTRHYTDSSDNPTWSTQATVAAPNTVTKTEIYTPSLGTGLNVTTTIQAGVATGSMQLHDLRGNTVTTINLTNNTASAWCSYDEFGNQDSSNPSNTNLVNYTTYGQAERATNTTGLILMGARVYNPETNQFTSPDPVKGGNENSYTYPNDPLNKSDFTGELGLLASAVLDRVLNVLSFVVGIAVCGIFGQFCQKVVAFVLVFIVNLVIDLVQGQGFLESLGDATLIAALSLVPGMSKQFFKRIVKVVGKIGVAVAKYLRKMKLSRLKQGIEDAITGWDIGTAVGNTLIGRNWFEEFVF